MKNKILLKSLILVVMLFRQSVFAQITLSGTNYFQDFNSVSNGLPDGWSVRTNATATSLGTVTASFNADGNSWAATAGEFRNCAAAVSDSGTNFIGTESTSIQATNADRALAIRQTGTFRGSDPGAAFVLQIANTIGLSNLTFAVDLELLKSNGYSTTWTIQYAVGDVPASFTTLGTFPDPGVFGVTRQNYHLGAGADNQPANVWIRIVALAAATGSGSRDTFGIDNFSLSWGTNNAVATVPFITGLAFTEGRAQINFTADTGDGPDAFVVQAADDVSGPFIDASDAKIVQKDAGVFCATNAPIGSQKFYRIKRP